MIKKIYLVFIALIMLITAACSSTASNEDEISDVEVVSEVEGTVRVSLAGWQLESGIDPITGVENMGLNEFIKKEFEPRYPNIKLEVYQVPWENAQAKQTAMLKSGDVDVLYTGGAFASQWQQQGLLRGLDDLMENDSTFDPSIYLEGVWENSYSTKSYDKSVHFGIPAILGRRIIMYDKQLFDEWGVDYLSENPSPEEVLEKAKAMTGKNPKTGEQNYGIWWDGKALNASSFVALSHAFGASGGEGTLNDLKNIKWKLNSPEMGKIFGWLEEAVKYAPPGILNTQGNENFGLEKNNIAIHLDASGASTMGEVKASGNKELLERYESTLNLGPNGEGWVAVDPFVMAKDTKNEEASWEVLKFLTGPITQEWNYVNFKNTPTLVDASFVEEEDKYMKTAMEIAQISKSTLLDEANPFFGSEIVPAINGFISKAHNGDAPDIQSYLDDLQSRAEKWSANQ
ncbi:extracellular solute-binding protein [Metabacillus sp. KUDC1714]|uniref:Extracellular solute-binding protein n=1 Tax=Metabacillus elymi TaxID=2745198 RepID=A0ABX6S1F4_9BACI|nr:MULTISPECIES: extracellular solute-binding protein [Metabacillus]QNF26690.1 extracellular solute-binding protein [Metabacillus sp. KUDC1714]